jgi:hypothetical protein
MGVAACDCVQTGVRCRQSSAEVEILYGRFARAIALKKPEEWGTLANENAARQKE